MDGQFPHPLLTALQTEALTILAEEANEVAIECSKMQRSGPDFCRRGRTVKNVTHLSTEIIDFMVIYGVCQRLGLIDETIDYNAAVDAKIERLKEWSNLGDVAAEVFA